MIREFKTVKVGELPLRSAWRGIGTIRDGFAEDEVGDLIDSRVSKTWERGSELCVSEGAMSIIRL